MFSNVFLAALAALTRSVIHFSDVYTAPHLWSSFFVKASPVQGPFADYSLEQCESSLAGLTGLCDQIYPVPGCDSAFAYRQKLITGDFSTREGAWRWQAELRLITRNGSVHLCGATLINSNTLLTAAHCVHIKDIVAAPNRLLVHVGKRHREILSEFTQEFRVKKVISHPHYNNYTISNDIAILELESEVLDSDYVIPVFLDDAVSLEGHNGTLLAWEMDGDKNLIEVSLPIVSKSECLRRAKEVPGIFPTDSNFCAGFLNGSDVCRGDSGSGFFVKESSGKYFLRGIVSHAGQSVTGCSGSYVVLTDVAKYRQWIENNTFS